MKRIACVMTVTAAVLSAGVTAFASPTVAYTGGEDKNNVTAAGVEGYSTVLITDSKSNIVYLDQADSAFAGVKVFFIKSSPAPGVYTAKFGSLSGGTEDATFYIGTSAEGTGNDTLMTNLSRIQDEETKLYSAGFYATVTVEEYNKFNSLKVCYLDSNNEPVTGGFALKKGGYTTFSGEGSMVLVFELDDITESEIASVSVFLSEDEVTKANAYRE